MGLQHTDREMPLEEQTLVGASRIFSLSSSCGESLQAGAGLQLGHHAANHMRGHTRIIPLCERRVGDVKEGWGADAPKTAGVVVQASYRATGSRI